MLPGSLQHDLSVLLKLMHIYCSVFASHVGRGNVLIFMIFMTQKYNVYAAIRGGLSIRPLRLKPAPSYPIQVVHSTSKQTLSVCSVSQKNPPCGLRFSDIFLTNGSEF